MLRKNQLDNSPAGLTDARAVGVHYHTLLHPVIARGHELILAGQLDHAHSAGPDFVDALQVAERGNMDADGGRRIQNRGAFLHLVHLVIDRNRYHL